MGSEVNVIQQDLLDLISKRCRLILTAKMAVDIWKPIHRLENLSKALSFVTLDGHYLEFGVAGGVTINHIAQQIDPKVVYGFDTFQGLPESDGISGSPWFKGAFAQSKIPAVRDNVSLVVGLFEDTLPTFKNNITTTAFLHVDCDLYSSTKTVFDNIGHTLQEGSIVVFDEFHRVDHEALAFVEWLEKENYYAILLNRTDYYQQTTFVLSKTLNVSEISKKYFNIDLTI
jgi:hypothetical protein